MKKVTLSFLIVIILIFTLSTVASASYDSNQSSSSTATLMFQTEVRGSIRGTVYEDRNADGVCVGTGEPALGGINVQFVSDDGGSTVHLQSGPDGTYGLVAVGLGTWTVTAIPLTGFSVSSENPQVVFISAEQPDATGVDFCIVKGSGSGGGSVVLPESGASIAPPLLIAALTGVSLVAAGAAFEIRRRLSS
ncbi:MAG: hypothetical protein BMS9Abin02_0003 [Anaerolineae bacterium]|nr:MAG: hypothetical protein BMS9Abin02_0003 [Anaerolineae bacterium]